MGGSGGLYTRVSRMRDGVVEVSRLLRGRKVGSLCDFLP